MGRPQRHTDTTLIDAAAAVIAERGPLSWSLEDVAQRCGMSPAALVKRFGSKRDLLKAVVTSWVASIPTPDGEDVAGPLERLETLVREEFAGLDAAAAPGHLGLLLAELADVELRALVREGWRKQEERYVALIAAAQAMGAVQGPPADQAGHLLMALTQGIALRWSVLPEGSLPDLQVEALRALLDGWRS